MRRSLILTLIMLLGAITSNKATARGILLPKDKNLPPLALTNISINIQIQDQIATTTIEQTFRNHTERNLEAQFIMPIPNGANVKQFSMWIDGKEQNGELLDASQARGTYESIVRRIQDPGLLEFIDSGMIRCRVFPIQPKKDQKIKISYNSVLKQDSGVVEYLYPSASDQASLQTLEKYQISATIKSQSVIGQVYSPSHAIDIARKNPNEVEIHFQQIPILTSRDFQLFYTVSGSNFAVTPIFHRPISTEDGYVMLLVSPSIDQDKIKQAEQDLVLVLDTSGSMSQEKMNQAKKALKFCLKQLKTEDRFAILTFSNDVRKYREDLEKASEERLNDAMHFVDQLRASGGTAINAALEAVCELRPKNTQRPFTIIFFTDGVPTIGETKIETILKNFNSKNSANTRLFTFGVGDDVNTILLDQLANETRAVSTYVRPHEDIEAKVSSMSGKISHPALTNLQLTTSENLRLEEIYPIKLPDYFLGSQHIVLAKYRGKGAGEIVLNGVLGNEKKSFVTKVNIPDKTGYDHGFIEELWARRKVGFMLDEIRKHGESKELKTEIVRLAKQYGIVTPYTSYLVVPDGVSPVIMNPNMPMPKGGFGMSGMSGGMNIPGGGGMMGMAGGMMGGGIPMIHRPSLASGNQMKGNSIGTGPGNNPQANGPPVKLEQLARENFEKQNSVTDKFGDQNGVILQDEKKKLQDQIDRLSKDATKAKEVAGLRKKLDVQNSIAQQQQSLQQAATQFQRRQMEGNQSGKIGVDLAINSQILNNQNRLNATKTTQTILGRHLLNFGDVWVDEDYESKMKSTTVKAQSDAYFLLLKLHPELKTLFKLGNRLVFILPNREVLMIDTVSGMETIKEEQVQNWFKKPN